MSVGVFLFFLMVVRAGAVNDASPPENTLIPNETKTSRFHGDDCGAMGTGGVWISSSPGSAQVADDDNNLYNHIQLPSSTSRKVNASLAVSFKDVVKCGSRPYLHARSSLVEQTTP